MKVTAILVSVWSLAIAGCASEPAEKPTSTPSSNPMPASAASLTSASCVADSPAKLNWKGRVPECKNNIAQCKSRCAAGDPGSCLGAAYAMEETPDSETDSQLLFHHACLLGVAIACTNHAAYVWSNTHTSEQLSCALRTAEKSCGAGDHFACGMQGRIALEGDAPASAETIVKVKAELEASCSRVGGFPCRVLALHLEKGQFGRYEPSRLKALLEKACKGGDSDACGMHSTVKETLNSD